MKDKDNFLNLLIHLKVSSSQAHTLTPYKNSNKNYSRMFKQTQQFLSIAQAHIQILLNLV